MSNVATPYTCIIDDSTNFTVEKPFVVVGRPFPAAVKIFRTKEDAKNFTNNLKRIEQFPAGIRLYGFSSDRSLRTEFGQ